MRETTSENSATDRRYRWRGAEDLESGRKRIEQVVSAHKPQGLRFWPRLYTPTRARGQKSGDRNGGRERDGQDGGCGLPSRPAVAAASAHSRTTAISSPKP